MDEDKIRKVIEEKIMEPDFQDCFVTEIKYNAGRNYLTVYMDSDSGMTLPKCKAFSRQIETYLDDTLLLGEHYGLDVSSPGLDRPLTMVRQYKKNIGRELKVDLVDGRTLIGELVSVQPEEIVLNIQKSKREVLPETLSFDVIQKSLVQIKFK